MVSIVSALLVSLDEGAKSTLMNVLPNLVSTEALALIYLKDIAASASQVS